MGKMKKKAYILILLLLVTFGFTPTKKTIIEGELYFSPFHLGSFYNHSDSIINRINEYYTNNFQPNDSLTSFDIGYQILGKENLLYHPYVQMLLPTDSTIIYLYLDTVDYEKIRTHKYKELQNNNKKVKINAEVQDLGNNMFFCKKLISVTKVDGITLIKQKRRRKLAIEDYQ